MEPSAPKCCVVEALSELDAQAHAHAVVNLAVRLPTVAEVVVDIVAGHLVGGKDFRAGAELVAHADFAGSAEPPSGVIIFDPGCLVVDVLVHKTGVHTGKSCGLIRDGMRVTVAGHDGNPAEIHFLAIGENASCFIALIDADTEGEGMLGCEGVNSRQVNTHGVDIFGITNTALGEVLGGKVAGQTELKGAAGSRRGGRNGGNGFVRAGKGGNGESNQSEFFHGIYGSVR